MRILVGKEMLINLSHQFSERRQAIEAAVGKPFSLEKRQELERTSMSNLPISAASIDIYNLLVLNERPAFCSVELRPKGVIISFQVLQETYALVIPFYKLKLYKGRAQQYAFYMDHYFIKVAAHDQAVHQFMKRLRNYKTDQAFPRIEDEP